MARLDSKPCHKSTIHFMDYTIVIKSIGYKNYSEKMKVLSGQCQVWNSRVECRKNPQKGVEIGIITWCRVKDHISIKPRLRRVSCMEIAFRFTRLNSRNTPRQQRVHCNTYPVNRDPAVGSEINNLARCMHPRVRPARSVDRNPFFDDLFDNPFEFSLNRRHPRLILKAEVVSAVVFNDDLDVTH